MVYKQEKQTTATTIIKTVVFLATYTWHVKAIKFSDDGVLIR